MPSPYLLATLQFAVGMVITVLIARNHVLPRLAKLDFHAALAPVLLLHGARLLGLSFLAPDQVGAGQDIDALTAIAFGDFAASIAGVAAAAAAYSRSRLTVPLAWVLTVVGLGDFAVVGMLVSSSGALESGLGFMWATFSLVAPALVLSHLYVVRALLRHRRGEAAPVAAPTVAGTA